MNSSSGTQPSNGTAHGPRQQVQWLETVAGLARRLSLTTEPGEIIRTSTKMISEAFDIEICAVLRYDEARQELICQTPAVGVEPVSADLIRFSVKEGTFMRSCWDRGEPWIVDDLAADPRFEQYRSWSQPLGLHSLLLGPLRVGQARMGALLWANKRSGGRFNQTDVFWIRMLADQISIALNHAQALNAQMREAKRGVTLAQIVGVLHATLDPREVMKAAASMILGAAGADRCHLFLKSDDEFIPALSVLRANGQPWKVGDVDGERVRWFREQWPMLDHDRITVIEDVYFSPLIPSTWTTQLGIKSLILVPLWAKEELVGCMMLEDLESARHVDASEVSFIEAVAAHCALALRNARLHASIQDQLLPLQESAITYPPLVKGAGAAILVIQEGRYGFTSGATTELLGYTADELVQMTLTDLFAPLSQAVVAEAYERLLEGQSLPSLDAWAIRKDGREVLLTIIGSQIEFEAAPAVQFIATDTTEQQVERDRHLQASKLEAVTGLIGNLVGEVRNALTPVVGYTELTLDLPGLSPELRSNLEIIAHGAERAKKTFDRLATWAEIRPPAKTPVVINDVLEQIMALRQYELQGYHVEVTLDLDESLGSLATQIDPQQIQIAFLAIIDNAKDALLEVPQERQLVIQTRHRAHGLWRTGEVITISFHDNGPGITRENLLRVFDPFFSTKPPTQALGLGLWITYQIIKNHGGEVYVRSQEGKGATFVVEMPILTNHTLSEDWEL